MNSRSPRSSQSSRQGSKEIASARVRAFAAGALLLGGGAAQAQPPPTPPPSAPSAPAEDPAADAASEDEIARALAADQAEAAESRPPASGAPAGTGGFQSLNPDLAFIADFAAAAFSDEDNLQGGVHDPHETGFNLQSLEMTVGAAVDPYFRFDANITFGGDEGIDVEEAYATTLALPASLQLRLGQFLTRFGRQNPTHPHGWAFVDQPLQFSRVFGGEANRGLGAELSWLAPLSWYAELVGSVTSAEGDETARSFLGEEDRAVDSPADFQTTLALKQFFPLGDDLSLLVGLSYAGGPNAFGRDTRTNVVATDVYLKYRPITWASDTALELQGEWVVRDRQVGPALTGGATEHMRDHGGYLQAVWRFARRWGTGARWELGSAPHRSGELAFADPLDPDWTGDRQRASAQLTFWPTEFSRFRLQGSIDDPAWRDAIQAAFLTYEFAIGAHGAHPF